MAVLVATLPRQVLILQYAYTIISYATNWSALKAKLQGLNQAIILSEVSKNITDRIQWDRLQFQISAELSLDKINLQQFDRNTIPSSGRITIRAANGAGKSSYLCWLKQRLGRQAYYLPAQHQLQFLATYRKNLSTGQALKHNIEEIATALDQNIRVIMLDEWDANLDSEVTKELDYLIDKLSKSRLVIEVRHRT